MSLPIGLQVIRIRCTITSIGVIANAMLPFIGNKSLVVFRGDLGAGKTTLIREIARKLGGDKRVLSPSFNKMFIHDNLFAHIDCYNINGDLAGLIDYVDELPLMIEWPDRCDPSNYYDNWLEVNIHYVSSEIREYQVVLTNRAFIDLL